VGGDRTDGGEVAASASNCPGRAVPGSEGSDEVLERDGQSMAEEPLRREISGLKAGEDADHREPEDYEARLEEQSKTIVELRRAVVDYGGEVARLKAELGRVAGALAELAERQAEPRASTEIEKRFRGKEAERAEWQEKQQKRRLPSDAVNNVIAMTAGAAIGVLPYEFHDFSAGAAGLAASAVALGAGMIAVWRERRKAKDDAHH
jgi:uncharacterized coiled-coil protein SlyX